MCNIQNAFHQNLMQMRETARASLLSLPNPGPRGEGDLLDESHSVQKTSGLRQYVPDDGNSEFDDSLIQGRPF